MKNIEEFNIAAAEILGLCYREFPKPAPYFKTEIGRALKDGMGVEHDPTVIHLAEHEYKIADHTLSWLIRAGYIWQEANNSSSSEHIRLSPLGLEVLNSMPASLKVSESIGESLAKGAKELGKEVLLSTVTAALSMGLSNAGA